ncbi:sporulation integral membrane protein YtvI [Paucisalibacillus globulus]|uniref:sporulation integral membrane protein YtvI n=1 Tax=Paucisalibacillus globulus TaxID=351095 RepID=UPI0004129EB1|nr:sporulation integral membrane protein YtvI [Paucisalibacillus globulus]
MYKQYIDTVARGFLLILILTLVFFIVKFTIGYIYPFIIAFIIAAMLNPSVSYFERKWKFPRIVATISVISLLLLLFFIIMVFLFNEIIQGLLSLLEKLPDYFQSFVKMVEYLANEQIIPLYQNIIALFQSLDPSQQNAIQENLENYLEKLTETGTNMIHTAIGQLPEIVVFFPNSITIFIFILLATFMMTNDWQLLNGKLHQILPKNLLSFVSDLHKGIKKAFSGYLRAQFILILISASMIYIGLVILKVDHALTIAAIAALVDLLPVVGTGIIFVPWILYSFVTGGFSLTIGLSILYMIVIIVRQMIEPKILSASIGVNPLVSLIILFVTIQVWGIAGVILAPLILIFFYVLFQSGIFIKMFKFIKG